MFSRLAKSILLATSGFSAAVSAYGVIVPLYIYPGNTCSAWTSVISSVAKYTSVPFYIIVNPNSGPGATAQPDTNYIACVPKLRPAANPNVQLLGYVPTGYGSRATSAVNADIATYAGWGAAYRPTGIFFDEAPTSASLISQYQSYGWAAWASFSYVVLNPGTAPDAAWYSGAGWWIVSAEAYYTGFAASQLSVGSNTPASSQIVILHDAPATPDANLINQLRNLGIAAVYMTDIKEANNPYGTLPTQWDTFVADVAA